MTRVDLATVPLAATDMGTNPGQGRVPVAQGGAGSTTVWQDKPELDIRDWGTVDQTGVNAVTTALNATLAEASALAQTGHYAPSQAATVKVPWGRFLIDGKISIPKGVRLQCTGWRTTVFVIGLLSGSPSTTAPFPDNAVFEPVGIDFSQEYVALEGFTLYGQGSGGTNIPTTNQTNTGASGTTVTGVPGPINASPFTLEINPIGGYTSLSNAGWPNSGTLFDATTGQRIMYQSLSGWSFVNCWISNGYGVAIGTGDTINAIATDNVVGIHVAGLGAPSYLRDIEISNMTGECVLMNSNNGLVVDNVFATYSNRDTFLYTGYRASNWFRNLTLQYSGQSDTGNTFACCHLQGQSAQQNFQGSLTIDGLYMEVTAHNQIGLHLDNVGNISADNIRLEGGVNTGGTSFATQVGVQIDSTQSTPTSQTTEFSANILISNLAINQVGRVPLKDNVVRAGGATFALPANGSGSGTGLTRYYTEDQKGPADRARTLLRGTVAAMTFEPAELFATSNLNQATTSGTQIGRTIPVLAGYSYGHVFFRVGTTGTTFGTNNDGHWYLAVYNGTTSAATLVTQTADQGVTAMTASSNHNLALGAPVVPTVDAMYTVVLMLYYGTGGTLVAPTLAATAPASGSGIITGLPAPTVTANAGQTSGTAPGTLGTVGTVNDIPFMGLYT